MHLAGKSDANTVGFVVTESGEAGRNDNFKGFRMKDMQKVPVCTGLIGI